MQLRELLEVTQALKASEAQRKLWTYFPDTGPLRRELYPKHIEFFNLGATHNERALLGGNRTGKTIAGAYETTLHLIGWYPHWWEGYRFTTAVRATVAGDTAKTVRDILQYKLLGSPGEFGTGMIPGAAIIKTTPKSGIPDAVESIYVKSEYGTSICQLKSYDQGREVFQGTEQEVVWFDEEVELPIYTEGLLRTMTVNGIVYLTFTPLKGLSETVLAFLPEYQPGETPK